MRKYSLAAPSKVIRVLVALIVLFIPIEAVANCFVVLEVYNRARRVPGEVNVECSGLHYGKWWQDKYDKGFGNWAVNSNYGRERNGFQFAGWHWEGGLLQWQSCTKKLPKPDCRAYNDNNCTGQKSVPDNERKYGGKAFYYGGTCATIGVHSADPLDMSIVELDRPDGDDVVSNLIYGGVDVPLTCSGAWRCRGESAWIYAGDGTVSAEVQIRVTTRFREIGR